MPTPDPEHPYAGDGRYRFPDINGMNLLGDNVSLPPIMPKSFHIMLTVFHPEALYSMKTWLPFCEDRHKQYKHTPTPVEYRILLVLQPPPIEGDVSLEETFDLYHKGMNMLKSCNDKIDKVEKKMLILDDKGEAHEFEN